MYGRSACSEIEGESIGLLQAARTSCFRIVEPFGNTNYTPISDPTSIDSAISNCLQRYSRVYTESTTTLKIVCGGYVFASGFYDKSRDADDGPGDAPSGTIQLIKSQFDYSHSRSKRGRSANRDPFARKL